MGIVIDKFLVVIGCIHEPGELKLLQVIQARNSLALGLGLVQSRQQHGRENRDDRDHHQQFNQSKPKPGAFNEGPIRSLQSLWFHDVLSSNRQLNRSAAWFTRFGSKSLASTRSYRGSTCLHPSVHSAF